METCSARCTSIWYALLIGTYRKMSKLISLYKKPFRKRVVLTQPKKFFETSRYESRLETRNHEQT